METDKIKSHLVLSECKKQRQRCLQLHSTKTVRKCNVCRKVFKNLSTYRSHLKLHKVNKKLAFSDFCRTNVKLQAKPSLYQCRLCGVKIKGFAECFEHQQLHEKHNEFFDRIPISDSAETDNTSYNANNQNEQSTKVIVPTSQDVHILTTHAAIESSIKNDENNLSAAKSSHDGFNAEESSQDIANLGIPSHNKGNGSQSDEGIPFADSGGCKLGENYDGMQIDVPNQIKAIYLNSVGPDLSDVMKQLEELNKKVDSIMKVLNIPENAADSDISLSFPSAEFPSADKPVESENDEVAVILEGFPPTYSVIQAAKEHQQQEFYASSIANRQRQFCRLSEVQHLTAEDNDKELVKKVPEIILEQPYFSAISSFPTHDVDSKRDQNTSSPIISNAVLERVFAGSRSRANFSKNLCFAIFSAEERQGKNCTGRVFGKAQSKGQLDAVKLQAIKEATFRKYPCHPSLIDITWKKECITAIDSGLRNETRTAKSQRNLCNQQEIAIQTNDA